MRRRGWDGNSPRAVGARRGGGAGGAPDRQAEEPRGRDKRQRRSRRGDTDGRDGYRFDRQGARRRRSRVGPVTVLINNAGIAIEKLAVEQTEADWDAVINANLKGAYFLATEMARRMIARKQEGNIVNVASVLGLSVMKFLSPYTISKAGIIQATKAMALEFASQRIRVNALAPGYIDTEMNHDVWATPAGEKLTKQIPQRRVGAESDLDGAIMLLASSASRYMTGSVVAVDGGFLLAYESSCRLVPPRKLRTTLNRRCSASMPGIHVSAAQRQKAVRWPGQARP